MTKKKQYKVVNRTQVSTTLANNLNEKLDERLEKIEKQTLPINSSNPALNIRKEKDWKYPCKIKYIRRIFFILEYVETSRTSRIGTFHHLMSI